MAAEQTIGSIIAVDCGTVMTKAALLDRVAGCYRFVARGQAPTTSDPPWRDVTIGVQHALEQIEEVAGRTLLARDGSIIIPEESTGVGVDALVTVASAAEPLSVVLAGLVRDLSLSSGERAIAGTYSSITGIIGRDLRTGQVSEEDQVHMIVDRRPEAVCITGGTDDGASRPVLEMVEAAALGCSMIEEEARPFILYAGNTALRKQLVQLVAGRAEVQPVDNVRPELDLENLAGVRAELERLYHERKLRRLPGADALERWSAVPLGPAARAFSQLVQYLGCLDESPKGTLGVDIGAAHTTVVAVFDGQLHLTINSGVGGVFGGQRLLRERGGESITRWLPTPLEAEAALGMLLSQEIRPWTVPQELPELWLQQALAREAVRDTLRKAKPGWLAGGVTVSPELMPQFDPILLSGGVLAGASRPGQAALIALDAIEPVGVSTLLLDTHGLAAMLGGVASLKPLATVETLDSGGIVNLATVVAPVGTTRPGRVALSVRIQYQEGGTLEVEVPYGSLEVLPLPAGQEAVLELRPRGSFDVGLGGPGKRGRRRVHGGLAGLIIDARGRPLRLPADHLRRQSQVQQWLWDVGG